MVNAGYGKEVPAGDAPMFEQFVNRMGQNNGLFLEALNRLNSFSDRLQGPMPQPNGCDKNSPAPAPQSVTARLDLQIAATNRNIEELHSVISRLERLL